MECRGFSAPALLIPLQIKKQVSFSQGTHAHSEAVSNQAPVAVIQRPLNAPFVMLLAGSQGSGVWEEKLKLKRPRFCTLGLFWDNDKGHESQGMPDRARLCLISEREYRTAPGKGPGTGHSFKTQRPSIAEPEQRERARGGNPERRTGHQSSRAQPR